MLAGVLRIIVGFVAATAMFLMYTIVLPVVVMVVTLYICRLIPMTGRRSTDLSLRATNPLEGSAVPPGLIDDGRRDDEPELCRIASVGRLFLSRWRDQPGEADAYQIETDHRRRDDRR